MIKTLTVLFGLIGAIMGAHANPVQAATKTPDQWAASFAKLPTYGDGNASCRMDHGRRAFTTGDTILRAGGEAPHSTLTMADAKGLHVVRTGYGASGLQAVPDRDPSYFHWLGPCAFWNGRLYVLSPVVHADGSPIRTDLVEYKVLAGKDPQFIAAWPMPKMWNASLWVDNASGLVYWWGASPNATDGWTGRDAYVARTRVRDITKPGAWSYWNGSGWSYSVADAHPVLTSQTGGGVDLAFSAWLDSTGWHLTSRYGGPWGTLGSVPTLSRWTSRDLRTWARRDLATLPSGAYLAWEHHGLGATTFNTAGSPATWIASS